MKHLTLSILLSVVCAFNYAAGQDAHTYGDRLGRVSLPADCSEAAAPHLERGLSLLHHMTYDVSAAAFAAAAEADPHCAMGYWGQALSYVHPLWSDPPTEERFTRGVDLLEKAVRIERLSERERAYIAAVAAYYQKGWNRNESANLAAFEKAWESVHRDYPDDPEAAAVYALSMIATADPADKTYANQKRAGALAERVLAQNPDHPGAHHYIIHAYDVPALSDRALDVARRYGDLAPAVPHALHMPSHIFTRQGLWEESIAWNRRSADAALNHPVGDAISMHYLHALDYLAYAYLQRGEDRKAHDVLEMIDALEGPFHVHLATPYTLAAVPARIALERQNWESAAALEARKPSSYPWDNIPAIEAITHFARALGAARSGDTEAAAASIEILSSLHEKAAETSPYWARQVEVQHLSASAWLDYERGEREKALDTMRKAAEVEASTEKHPVTPGEVLPAYELLGDMLLEMGRFDEAGTAYETALARSPNRLNSLHGAGRAAELGGRPDVAAGYYSRLAQMTSSADSDSERLRHARAYLSAN